MKHNNMKFAAYALVGVIAVGSISVSVDATGVSSLLPAAGLTLTMEEGSAQEEVRASTKSKTDNKEREKEKENKEKKEEKEENSTKSLKRDIGVKDSDEEIKPVETAAVKIFNLAGDVAQDSAAWWPGLRSSYIKSKRKKRITSIQAK